MRESYGLMARANLLGSNMATVGGSSNIKFPRIREESRFSWNFD